MMASSFRTEYSWEELNIIISNNSRSKRGYFVNMPSLSSNIIESIYRGEGEYCFDKVMMTCRYLFSAEWARLLREKQANRDPTARSARRLDACPRKASPFCRKQLNIEIKCKGRKLQTKPLSDLVYSLRRTPKLCSPFYYILSLFQGRFDEVPEQRLRACWS